MKESPYRVGMLCGARFEEHWPGIRKMMEQVPHTWEGSLTLESTYERVLTTSIQVWAVGEGERIRMVLFTQIARHAAGSVLEIFWGCGTGIFKEALPTIDAALEQFARFAECDRINVIGREGWGKFLLPHGFTKLAVVYTRPVHEMGVH